MKKTLMSLLVAGLLPGTAIALDETSQLDQARQTVAAFAGTLKSELMVSMQSGGAVKAVEVCNTRAPVIAEDISIAYDTQVSRVSQRYRNPDNAPNKWQSDVLESFEERKNAGEAANTLVWAETVETESGEEFRFMKAIPTAGLCLQCHGTEITAAVSEKLAVLYPEDKATGFSETDIRGAFVVTRKLD